MQNQASIFGYIESAFQATDQEGCYEIKFRPIYLGNHKDHMSSSQETFDITLLSVGAELCHFLSNHTPLLRLSCQLHSHPESRAVRLVTDIAKDLFLISIKGRSYRPNSADLQGIFS